MNEPADPILELENITKKYGYEVLCGVNLSIRPGEVSVIYGESGAGKSTLLNIIGSFEQMDSGKRLFHGKPYRSNRDTGNRLGFIFQEYHLLEDLTVSENMEIPLLYQDSRTGAEQAARMDEIIGRLGLDRVKNQPAGTLSGGQKQRTAIARAIVLDPELIIADEPTGNLDEENAGIVKSILLELKNCGKAVLVVTHDRELFPEADHFYLLHNGILTELEG